MKTLNAEDQSLVASAVCEESTVNPFSGSSGQWAFGGTVVDDKVAFFCPHPFAPNSLAIKSSRYHGEDISHCDTLYSELVYPHHLAACLAYIGLSLAFAGIYTYYTLVMHRKRDQQMKLTRKTKPMQKVYMFGVAASIANALACVDMKAWAGVYTLASQQVLVELSAGFLHCGLFILMTMWISISQTKNSAARTVWLERLQYICGAISVVAGCTLGYLEWALSSDPKRGSKNGTLTASKHLVLALMEATFSAVGTVMALQLLYRIKKSSKSVPVARGRAGSTVGALKVRQLEKIGNTITSYLCAVTVMVSGMVWYRVDKAIDSWGKDTYRYPPCSSHTAWVFFSPITVLVFLLIFAVVAAPARGESPPRPTRDSTRFIALNPFTKSGAQRQSGPQGEEQWNSMVKSRLAELDAREAHASSQLSTRPPSFSRDDGEEGGCDSRSGRSSTVLTNEQDTRPSQWTDWGLDEPTITEAQEVLAASMAASMAANSDDGL